MIARKAENQKPNDVRRSAFKIASAMPNDDTSGDEIHQE
jgi:hypothetical protein